MIRNATLADIPWILHLVRAMWGESQYERLSFSENKIHQIVQNAIMSQNGIAVLSENGFLIGGVKPHWASDDLVAYELGIYVTPEHRGSFEAIRLIDAYVARARELGARQVSMGISTGVDIERTERFYGRLGFTRVGAKFVKEI